MSRLFPGADSGRAATRKGLLLGLLAVLAATVVSLLRTSGTGPLQSVFEEDARDILSDALDTSGAKAVLTPVQGYFVIGPRLLGELATFFPISWAAAVLSIGSAVICGLLAVQVYVAAGAHVRNRWARVAVAAPLLLVPVAENMYSEIYNRPVCLHFFALYALFWVLLWTPSSRAGRAGALTTVGLTAVSTALIVGYLPLAITRLCLRRDRLSTVMFALVVAGSALQVAAATTSLGRIPRDNSMRLDPGWALLRFADWALPQALLGTRSGHPDPSLVAAFVPTIGVVALAWAIVGLVVAAAVLGARRGALSPAWLLSAALGVHAVGLLALQIMINGSISQRYTTIPAQLLIAALVVLLPPAAGRSRLASSPLAALCALLLAVAAVNYRSAQTYRHDAPQWTDQLRQATQWCADNPAKSAVVVRGAPKPLMSYVVIPCHEVRGYTETPWLDPP
ncbi:hypothetical protein [Actinocrispum sp. NPDC049592]|uniref:hypothetical protein n=1 Tax=Actinocrispum sp. NPDC049592 TaxID=3154835 RepID=UPI00343DEB28